MAGLFDDLKDGAPGGASSKQGLFDDLKAPTQNTSLAGDLGTDLKRGVQKLPGIATGLADIPVAALTNKRFVDETADKLGEVTGFQPSQWAEEARDEYSPERQAGSAEIDRAWEEGTAVDVAGAYISNPGNIAGMAVESVPQMLAGGVLGRGALAAGRATGVIGAPTTAAQAATQGAIAGGVGEGAVIAGGTMDQIDRDVEPRRAAAAAAGAGAVGSVIGVLGAKAAQGMGVVDAESLIAGGAGQVAGEAPGLARRVAGGALTEGVLEELPQSVQETMFQNWAEEKDLTEGLARAAVEGTLAGSAIGAGVNVLPRKRSEEMGLDPNAGPLSAAAVTAVDSEQALLPAPERLALPAPDQTLYADEQGNVSEQGPARDVDREQRPVPGREQPVRDFGPGMDQQVERGTVPVAGELMPAAQPDAPMQESAEPRTFDAQPERQGIPDLRESSINVDAEGNAVPGKIPTKRPADYVQGGRGMDQQAPVGKTYSNVLAAKNAIQRAGSADVLEAVQVGPKQFEVRAIAPPAASQDAPVVEPAPVQPAVADAVNAAPVAQAATPTARPAPVKPVPQPVDRKDLPEVLRHPKKLVITRMAKAAGIKKGSPGYDAAVGRLESEYERQVDDAQAALPFEQFNALNKESPEGVNRQAWTQLRKERGIEDAPTVDPAAAVSAAAAEAATSPANDMPEPTDAQKEAGNYRKGHVSVQGLSLAIENPKGSVRRGKRPDGSEWSHAMSDHYGYIKRTEGADGDHVDIYLGDNPASDQVFVIDQVDQKGGFDEHKVMLGFDSQADAVAAYKKNFDAGWKVGPVTPMPMAQFKEWLKDGDTKSPLVGASAELASAPAASSTPKAPAAKIEDAGEKLGGARKDELRGVRERLADMDDEAIASSSLSELWPKDEINRIEDTFQAASYQTVREYIPAKPRVTYKLTGWVNKVKAAREIIDNLSEIGADATVAKMRKFSPGLRPIADKVELLMGIDRAQWGRIGRVSMASGSYNVEGKMTPGSWVEVQIDGRNKHFFGKNSIAEALDDVRSTLNLNSAPEKKMKFDVYTDRGTREVFIAKSGDRETRRLATFKTTAEARDYINNSHNSLVAAWDAVKNRDNVTKADMRRDLNEVRTGRDYRNSADITPDQLLETFGFRGVEFGNWVSQGSGNADRQGMLNQAYDAFMDLADVIGVPPKALSLEGRLGIGFGSRGRGRASAHFEPDTIVINLTKTKGAGSLAHEWFHAADNYFAGKRQERAYGASRESSYITYRPEPMMVNTRYPSQKLTRAKLDIYQANHPNAPLYAEENWATDPAHPNGVRPQVEKAFAELVETLDRSPMAKRAAVLDSGTSDGYWSRIIERGARSFETYVIAKLADQGYRNDYLANVRSLEEFSRNQDRYPYLTPDEQGPVSEAFDKLFATIETRVEADGNVAMYSRQSYRQGQTGEGSRAVQLRLQLKRLIGGWQNAPEIKVVQSIKDLPDAQRRQVERDGAFDVEGMYADGQVYLVADNLRDVKHAAFVLQHEVLGHAGLQGAYGKRLTPLLMSIYNSNAELKSQADALVQRFGYQPAVAMEEVLADMAAAGTIQEQAFWPRLLTAMRNALRSIGLQVGWSDGDIQGLLANARRYIRSGTRKGRGRSVYSRNGSSGRMVEMVDEKGRLLAPNGKPSKLNQKQWHQVRSENFKRWFGDWQAVNAQERLDAVKPLKLRMPEAWKDLTERERLAKVEESLKGMAKLSEPLPHDELGEVVMGMSGAKKSASSAADPAKQAILSRLQSAFEHSIYASSSLDQNAPTMTAYHKLLAPIDVDGVPLVAVFTVREDANGRMFYNTVAVDRKEEAPAVSPGDMSNETQRSTPANTRAPGDFVRQPLQRVNPADVSKVLDANGEPLVLYHGTAEQFNVFDQTRAGRSTGHTTAPLGIFLTNDGTLAKAYAEKATDGMPGLANVMPLFASVKKPYRMSVAESQNIDTFDKALSVRQRLEGEGYDGIQLGNTGTWVAFYNNQVKSATNNTGAFDEVDPDIRYRRAGQWADEARDLFNRATGPAPLERNDPFAAENRRLREGEQTLWQKAKKQFARQFAPGGLLPDAVFAEKITRDSEFQAVEFDVRHLSGGLNKAVKADYGVDLDNLTAEQMKPLAEALAGRVDPAIPEATRVAIVAMRQYIDSLSGEYLSILQKQVEANMEGADQALIDKITGNLGAYVNRSYQAFDDPKWFKTVPTEVVNTARAYLASGYMEQGETAAEARRLADVTVNEMLKNGTAYDSMGAFIAEGKLGAKDLTVLIKRKEIAPEIRALLGEYMDPRLNFAKSATKMGRLVWNQRFLDRVLSFGMGTILFEGKNRPADATTQIAGEKSETYAPLNGLWTFPEVAQAFQDALGKEQMSDLYRTVVRLNGMVKYGKTILSPTTAMRNWQSAMFFSLANGHFDLTQMKNSWAAMREQVTQNATGEDLVYLRKLKRLGVVYDTPYAGEMMALLQDARMDELLSSKSGTGLKWLRKANQFAQGFYSFGDDFWKIIGFENEKAGLLKAGIPLAEAEAMAAKRIRDTYPTYSMIGKAIQWLRRFPLVGTFVSFPSEIIRTSVNMLQLTAADLKSDNPGLRAIGRKRAAGIAMVSGGFYALAALTAAAAGVGDDEEEALRDLAAPWSKNSTFLYTGRDADGKLRYFDLSFLDPYGYWKRPLTAMMRDQPWEKAAASGLSDMLSPFFGADITAGAIFEVLANKKPTGGPVFNPDAGSVDQLQDISNHMRKALQPGFMSNGERLLKAFNDERRDGSGQPYDMRDELVSLLGWRASTLDTQTGLYYRSFDFTDALSNARKTLTRTLRSSNPVTDGEIGESKQAANAQYQQAFTEMGRLVSAAQAAGMTRAEVVQTLKTSGIAQANIMALVNGRVPPMQISLAAQAKAVKQARTMRDSEHAAEIARRFRLAREQ
ncbi:LPD5 domain-containing protein [uncultured Pseudomonas sp.]|uniref:ADP-ribosyltransferase-containing protein n=1 Tax=uncultured Pseudomonas sp. TaxID=114707 RepID=UPI0030DB5D8E